jgi:hypothetical protein
VLLLLVLLLLVLVLLVLVLLSARLLGGRVVAGAGSSSGLGVGCRLLAGFRHTTCSVGTLLMEVLLHRLGLWPELGLLPCGSSARGEAPRSPAEGASVQTRAGGLNTSLGGVSLSLHDSVVSCVLLEGADAACWAPVESLVLLLLLAAGALLLHHRHHENMKMHPAATYHRLLEPQPWCNGHARAWFTHGDGSDDLGGTRPAGVTSSPTRNVGSHTAVVVLQPAWRIMACKQLRVRLLAHIALGSTCVKVMQQHKRTHGVVLDSRCSLGQDQHEVPNHLSLRSVVTRPHSKGHQKYVVD